MVCNEYVQIILNVCPWFAGRVDRESRREWSRLGSFCSACVTVNEALTDREHAEYLQPDKNNVDR